MAQRYVSNKDESVPLFENRFLDRLSYVHPSVPVVLYLPVIAFLVYRALAHPTLSVLALLSLFLGGILAWTFTEYVIHRFVFHLEGSSAVARYILHLMHGVHHDYPNDSRRLVMPPVISIPLALFFYGVFGLLLEQTYLFAFFPGFLFGYVCYDTIHYATHHFPMKSRIGQWLKRHHIRHHYQDEELGYGVSSPLWDYVFKTTFPKK
ncbi:MAG: sterol desaturase family protein [bacterium]